MSIEETSSPVVPDSATVGLPDAPANAGGVRYRISAVLASIMIAFSFVSALSLLFMILAPKNLYPVRTISAENPVADIASRLFAHSVFAILALACAANIRKRTNGAKGGIIYKLAGVALAMNFFGVCSISGMGQLKSASATTSLSQAKAEAAEMADFAENIVADNARQDAGLSPEAPAKNPSNLQGDSSKAVVEFVSGVRKDADDYQQFVAAANFDSLLEPKNLASSQSIDKSLKVLQSVRAEFERVDASIKDRMVKLKNAAIAANASPQAIASLDRKKEQTTGPHGTIGKNHRYEREILDEIEAILVAIQKRPGTYDPKSDLVTLHDEDLLLYQDGIARVRALGKHQQIVTELGRNIALQQAAEWRRFSQSGGTPPQTITIPIPQSAAVPINLAADAPILKGLPLSFPITASQLIVTLGQPSRTVRNENVYMIWDSVGIVAISNAKPSVDPIITSLAFCTNVDVQDELFPHNAYEGAFTIGNANVTDTTTPRSLNRQIQGAKFQPLDQYQKTWAIDHPNYCINLWTGADGLVHMVVVGPPVANGAIK